MSKKTTVKPGQTVPKSGQYEIVGPRGGREATLVKGSPAPATPKPGQQWELVDSTNNSNSKK